MSLSLHDLPYDGEVMRLAPGHFYPLNGTGATEKQSDKVNGGVDLVNNGTVTFDYAAFPPFASGYPRFAGTVGQYLEAPAARSAYGQAQYAYSFWFIADFASLQKPSPLPQDQTLIAEHGPSGTSGIDIELHIPVTGGPQIQVAQTDDTGAVTTTATSGLGAGNELFHCVVVRGATQWRIYMNGGTLATLLGSVKTMTNAGAVSLRLGSGGRAAASPFKGTIFRAAFYPTAAMWLNSDGTFNDARVRAQYERGIPVLTAAGITNRPINRPFPYPKQSLHGLRLPQGKDSSVFPLDTSVNLTSLRATLTTAFTLNVNPIIQDRGSSGCKCYMIEEGKDVEGVDYTMMRVRQTGGRGGNSKNDREGFWQSFAQVPIPKGGILGAGMMALDDNHRGLGGSQQLDGNDRNCMIVFKRLDGRWSVFWLWHAGMFLGYNNIGKDNYTITPGASGSGSITAGVWRFAFAFYNANGPGSANAAPTPGVTLDGTQAVTISSNGLMEDPADANPTHILSGEGYQGIVVYAARTDVTGTAAQWFVAKRVAFGGGFPKPTLGTQPVPPNAPTGTALQTGGTLPAGGYAIQVAARNAYGSTLASPKSSTKTITSATGSVVWAWNAVPGATSYDVYGRDATKTLKFITNVTTNAWTDDGSIAISTKGIPTKDNSANLALSYTLTDLSAAEGFLGDSDAGILAVRTGQTSDPSMATGGYEDDVRTSPGWNNKLGAGGASRTDWSSSASNLQQEAMILLAHEAARGDIRHPLGISFSKGNKLTFQYPAQSTDSTAAPVQQGMILAWPRGTMAAFFAANPTTPAGNQWSPLFRAFFWVGENCGFCIKDSTAAGFAVVAEEDTFSGRSPWRTAYAGYKPPQGATPSSDADGGLHNLPWTDLLPVSVSYVRGWIGVP